MASQEMQSVLDFKTELVKVSFESWFFFCKQRYLRNDCLGNGFNRRSSRI
jgi:hypothetical protein